MPFREGTKIGKGLHATQGRDIEVMGINVEIVMPVSDAFQEITNKFMNVGIFWLLGNLRFL